MWDFRECREKMEPPTPAATDRQERARSAAMCCWLHSIKSCNVGKAASGHGRGYGDVTISKVKLPVLRRIHALRACRN